MSGCFRVGFLVAPIRGLILNAAMLKAARHPPGSQMMT